MEQMLQFEMIKEFFALDETTRSEYEAIVRERCTQRSVAEVWRASHPLD